MAGPPVFAQPVFRSIVVEVLSGPLEVDTFWRAEMPLMEVPPIIVKDSLLNVPPAVESETINCMYWSPLASINVRCNIP